MYLLKLILVSSIFSYTKCIHLGLLETAKNPFQYLEEKHFPYENHTVITKDGYCLLLVRLLSKNTLLSNNGSRPPVLFVHGIYATFYDFLFTGPGVAFGFEALESGYDVFLLNTRGSRFSRQHVTLDLHADAAKYWDFSWHEVGVHDITATIDYIINLTGYAKVSYVGHSQGGAAFFAMASTKTDYNSKIKLAVLLAPVTYFSHTKFLLAVVLRYFIPLVKTVLSAYLANYPAGGSVKENVHFLQNSKSGYFRLYDYGKKGNLRHYGKPEPPDYKLRSVTCPVIIYYGANDFFVASKDEMKLENQLPNVIQNVKIPGMNHFDVIMGSTFSANVRIPVIRRLNQYNNL